MGVVDCERQDTTAIITLNRPERRNALNRELVAALTDAVQQCDNDDGIQCVLLTGAPPAFCAGMDLAELSATLDVPGEAERVHEDAARLSALYEQIYQLSKPTLAVVRGAAVAGGAGLVSVCDLALADSTAKFGYPEVKRGLVAAMVMPHLLRHVGERGARELLLRGELVDAYHAWRLGLINEVVGEDELMATALEWARSLATSGPLALAQTKHLLRQFCGHPSLADVAAKGSAEARLTVECKEGLRAFLEKRNPPWVR